MRPQEKYTRSNVSQFVELSPWVQILDVPVPQVVDMVTFFKQFLVEPDDSQVIDVPKISLDDRVFPRASLRLPQVVGELVESCAWFLSPRRSWYSNALESLEECL